MLVPRLNLKAIAAKLPTDEFIRVHRSFIVAESKVTSYQKGQLFLGQKVIPVGITYQEKLMNRFS
jgi:DNA-binding LytR/AlgR family response regulator